ncbi:MAG: 50S ribosomal protein L7/L12 [Erysipelotrichaceae bacterium]|nr:50S ribosomal protein L7/L12 [Erysipelotrichaceae bacterium]MBR4122535.1 50S ribosomal protein L7/L12 [Erysipelotrichaceae bacterium]
MAEIKKEDILSYLESATILELNELVKAIEEKFGVTAAAPVAVATAPAEEAEQSGPSTVTVTLTSAGQGKVAVIKLVRELTGAGLMDAKKMVDNVPATIKENVSPEEGAELKKKFEEAGATVEVK